MLLKFHTSVVKFVSLAIVALVLLQRGRGAEAGAGFGAGASGSVFGARGATEIGLEVGLGFAVGPQPPVLVALIFAFLAGTASGVSIGSVVGVLGGGVCGVVEAILPRRAGFPGWERLRPYAPCWPSIAPIGLIISDAAYFFDTYGNPDWELLCLALILLLLSCSVALVKTQGSAAASIP